VDDVDGSASDPYALHDRGIKFCGVFRSMLQSGGVEPILLPSHSPNSDAFAESWVRSIKYECLSKLILFGEVSPRRSSLREASLGFHSHRCRERVVTRAGSLHHEAEA
jgi:hypothetical protein